MNNGKIIDLVSNSGESVRCRLANSFFSRLKGLMFSDPPSGGEGLLISPCNSIHMFFMKFAIDAIFLDRTLKIVKIVRDLKPGNLVGTVSGAFQVLELPSGNTPSSFTVGSSLRSVNQSTG